jgi:hypothetical protein
MGPDHPFGPKWTEHWGEALPISYRLRDQFGDRWVRFHSLPQSKRYPDGELEFEVLLGRHNAVIHELVEDSSEPDVVNVITASWSDDDLAHRRDPEVCLSIPERQSGDLCHPMPTRSHGRISMLARAGGWSGRSIHFCSLLPPTKPLASS